MPRVYRTKPEIERFLIREFLKQEGYRVSAATWPDRPDAVLTLRKDRTAKRTAIELTEHYHDTVAGAPSSVTPIGEFWQLVNSSLVKRLSHRQHLGGILGTVTFQSNPPFPARRKAVRESEARQLAAEIVEFMDAHPFLKESGCHFFRRSDFSANGRMWVLLQSMRLGRWTDECEHVSNCSWTCSNITTAHISVSLRYIKSALEQRIEKPRGTTGATPRKNGF